MLKSLQVADAEAATARLVAQMTDPSPDGQDAVAHTLPAQLQAGEEQSARASNLLAEQHQQHSSDRENVPEQQQRASKRGSHVQSAAPQPAAKTQANKRRKVSAADAGVGSLVAAQPDHQAAGSTESGMIGREETRQVLSPVAGEALDKRAGVSRLTGRKNGEAEDPQGFVGHSVQQQFEEGVFKVRQRAGW